MGYGRINPYSIRCGGMPSQLRPLNFDGNSARGGTEAVSAEVITRTASFGKSRYALVTLMVLALEIGRAHV